MRMSEWFDHYLKGKPAPDWMKNGIPRLQMEDTWPPVRTPRGRAGESLFRNCLGRSGAARGRLRVS